MRSEWLTWSAADAGGGEDGVDPSSSGPAERCSAAHEGTADHNTTPHGRRRWVDRTPRPV